MDDDYCDGNCGARGCDPRMCLDCGRYDIVCECDHPLPYPVCPDCGGPAGSEACGCTPPARAADEWTDLGEPVG